ncbi:MAG: putative toxin-antitoxin system toxin component, PIN family [Pyrinomonadaceae bacterium]
MADILQIVVDTNVLIAAFRSKRGAANRLINALDDSRWQINLSTPLLLEYEDVMKRPEMASILSRSEVDIFLDGLCSISQYCEIFFLWRLLSKDPKDAMIIELAVRANADFLITYNPKDFVALVDFGVKLISPREFLRFVGDLT